MRHLERVSRYCFLMGQLLQVSYQRLRSQPTTQFHTAQHIAHNTILPPMPSHPPFYPRYPPPPLTAALLATCNRYVAMPLSPDDPPAAVHAALQELGVACLVTVPHLNALLFAGHTQSKVPVVLLDTDINTSVARQSLIAEPCERSGPRRLDQDRSDRLLDDVVLILRTSGTTAVHKLVPFTLRRLVSAGHALAESMALCQADLGLNMMPLHHIGGIACNIFAPLISRGAMVFCPAFDAERWAEVVRSQGVTWCYMVPSM